MHERTLPTIKVWSCDRSVNASMLTKDRQLGERSIPLRASVPFSPRSHLGMQRSKVRSAASPKQAQFAVERGRARRQIGEGRHHAGQARADFDAVAGIDANPVAIFGSRPTCSREPTLGRRGGRVATNGSWGFTNAGRADTDWELTHCRGAGQTDSRQAPYLRRCPTKLIMSFTSALPARAKARFKAGCPSEPSLATRAAARESCRRSGEYSC
jgi:hypothetical protein